MDLMTHDTLVLIGITLLVVIAATLIGCWLADRMAKQANE